jgi:hypothetical protein
MQDSRTELGDNADAAEAEALEAVRRLKKAAARALVSGFGSQGRGFGIPDSRVPNLAGDTRREESLPGTAQVTKAREAVLGLNAAYAGAQNTLRQFAEQHEAANAVVKKFGEAIARNIVQASTYGRSIGEAARAAAKATVESIAAKAVVEAIYSTALGFLYLAEFDFSAAAQAFEAAAIFAAVGGAAAAVGAVVPAGTRTRESYGARGSGRGGYYGSEGQPAMGYEATGPGGGISAALAPGAQPAAQPSGGLTVAIMGNEEAGQWLATTLNKAVTQQGVQLVSSSSQRGAPVGH